jgi:hypothetical protein
VTHAPPEPTVGDEPDRQRAAAVADAVARAMVEEDVPPDGSLLVWSLAGWSGPPGPSGPAASVASIGPPGPRARGDDGADGLAAVLEAVTDEDSRRARGLHVTPRWLADELVALALPSATAAMMAAAGPGSDGAAAPVGGATAWPTVCDPSCGGGVFLLAAARRLHALGAGRRHIVGHLLWGADVDPVGLATAEAALTLWAGERPAPGRLVVADPLHVGAAAWPSPPPGGFGAVVGNPPFLSQLGRATVRSAEDRSHLQARFGPAVRAYTDTAWLFLLLGCELAGPGGRIVLLQPQSVVAARDAGSVRAAVGRRAALDHLWLDDRRVFAAAVRVCAPVLVRRAGATPAAVAAEGAPAPDDPDRWNRLWSRALDLPEVELAAGERLGDRATVVAGFRDQYYGLVGAVREERPGDAPDTAAPLVTSGAVGWAANDWAVRPTRFAKRSWQAPVVDLGVVEGQGPPVVRRWVERTRRPKLVVATQTRVVEAAVDGAGAWVPSVPALAVVPRAAVPGAAAPGSADRAPSDELWCLAAAILSPAATAWLVGRSPGTALDRRALRVAAPDLAALPLPAEADAWEDAAVALRAFVDAPGPRRLDAYAAAAAAAYGSGDAVTEWWWERAEPVVRRSRPWS